MSQSNRQNISQLFQSAKDDGMLSIAGAQAISIVDMGAQIQVGLGITADDVEASEVILVSLLIDDSGSIRFVQGNTQAVRDGHNLIIDALTDSKQTDNILMHTQYLNERRPLFPYTPLAQAIRMDDRNYNPSGGTPLYDQSVLILGRVILKAQEFASKGVPARTVTAIVTDGHDEGSRQATPAMVTTLVSDMLRSEMHIVAGVGIDDGHTDFEAIFTEMGIPKEWILTPKNSPSEIRKAFGTLSRSVVRASQSAGSFSKTALGGFGNP